LPINAFLNLNKPLGITAHDCISRVRKLLNQKKAGHSGTLDPMATGVLPIALGNCTRLLRFLPEGKAYKATIRFGQITTTDDIEGEIISQKSCPHLDQADVEVFLPAFQGKIQQRPPAFSAIQVNGVRMYDLARSGLPVEVPIRTVEVYKIEVWAWRGGDFPELELQIACGSGTYIRAIARDLGEKLNCGATLANLERTFSNGFDLSNSITFEAIVPSDVETILPEVALQHLNSIDLAPDLARRWTQGQALNLELNPSNPHQYSSQYHRIYTQSQFLGIGEIHTIEEQQRLSPVVVLEISL
jgi:tRNA pseudouridine55 synthase